MYHISYGGPSYGGPEPSIYTSLYYRRISQIWGIALLLSILLLFTCIVENLMSLIGRI